jgi:hypothetical protein
LDIILKSFRLSHVFIDLSIQSAHWILLRLVYLQTPLNSMQSYDPAHKSTISPPL